jgi:hypothetical protein
VPGGCVANALLLLLLLLLLLMMQVAKRERAQEIALQHCLLPVLVCCGA